jgi:uncharacterized protein (DUF488 family)
MAEEFAAPSWEGVRVHTLGHSTRSLDELVELLRALDIALLVDIRTIPRSRRNPQFNADTLETELRARGIRYVHLKELGGLRRPRPDSPNKGWRNESFRGYADYMQTEGFERGLERLHELASPRDGAGPIAIMCAEALPWRCHRSLVADALTARGAQVEHMTGPGRASPHRMTSFAEIDGARVSYPGHGIGRSAIPSAR